MIVLDRALIAEARKLTTGANVHQMKMRIYLYEEAVQLHNSGHPRHAVYHRHYEDLLREYVATSGPGRLLRQEAGELRTAAEEVQERSEQLQREMNDLKLAFDLRKSA